MPRLWFIGRSVLPLCGLAAFLLAGCIEGEEKIATYSAPRNEPPTRVRLLAAVIPQPEKTWFFKMSGPKDAVGKEEAKFQDFVQSVKFTGKFDPPLTWTTPDGWKQEPGTSQFRFATFRIGEKDAALEATISGLDGEVGTLIGNVNRWREQIGLEPIQESDLDLFTRDDKHPAGKVTFVDMYGPGKGGAAQVGAGGGPQYTKPDGWELLGPDPQGLYVLGFGVKIGDKSAQITVTPFPGDGGGLAANVIRWRRQLGLDDVTEDQIRREATVLPVAGVDGTYVDLVGQGLGERKGERILGVMVMQGNRSWFIKMKGPTDLVGQQKKAFESFAGSLRFDGAKGAMK